MARKFAALLFIAATLISGASTTDSTAPQELNFDRPLVIGHRGASGTLPEHTIEAYQLAIDQGADFIECDIVLTKDCELICRHEPQIDGTTNAADVFPELLKNYTVDGVEYEGIFSIDLTLEEIKTLRAKQAFEIRAQSYNGLYEIPTLEEYLQLSLNQSRVVGVIPEVKHPTFFDNLNLECMGGKTISEKAAEVMEDYGCTGPVMSEAWMARPCYIQSFEVTNLQQLNNLTEIPLVQLLDEGIWVFPDLGVPVESMLNPEGIADIAEYADVLSPWKGVLAPLTAELEYNRSAFRKDIVDAARDAGLTLSTWTMRNEAKYLPAQFEGDATQEFQFFVDEFGWGPGDSFFTDFPATGVEWLAQYEANQTTAGVTASG